MLRSFWVILAHELRRRALDRSALVAAVLAPLMLSGILGLAFSTSSAPSVRIGLALSPPSTPSRPFSPQRHGTSDSGSTPGSDASPRSTASPLPAPADSGISHALEQAVLSAGEQAAALPSWVHLVEVPGPRTLRREVADGTLEGGVIVPDTLGLLPRSHDRSVPTSPAAMARFLTPVVSPGTGNIGDEMVVVTSTTSLTGTEAASALASGIAARTYAGALADAASGTHSLAIAASTAASPAALGITITTIGNAGRSVLDYFAPSIAVIFLFITAGLGTRALLIERSEGTLVRMAAAPVRPASIVAGKLGAILATAFAGILAVWGLTTAVFHADWGNPAGVLLMCASATFAMGGISVLLTSFAKDERQAFGIAMVVGLALALLGGNLVPPGALPGLLQDLSLGTPNGWALVGFGRLALEGQGVSGVAGPVLVLVLIGAVTGLLAARRVHRMVSL